MSTDVIRSHLRNGEWDLARKAAEGALLTATPEEEGVLHALLGRAWYRLGYPRRALEEAEAAAARTDHWEASLALGEALVATGDPPPAAAILRAALDAASKRGDEGYSDDPLAPWRTAQIELRTALAEAYRASGTPDRALEVARNAVHLAEVSFGADSLQTAEALLEYGACLHSAGNDAMAEEILQRALTLWRAEGADHTGIAAALDALGKTLRGLGKAREAVALHREALAQWTRRLGPSASPVGACRFALAQALHRTGDFLAAREQMREALQITERTLGVDHLDTWINRFELGRFELDCGEFLTALPQMEEAHAVVKARLGAEHPVVKAMQRWL